MNQKIEFIESYIKKDGSDYQWNDNHGELIRCKDCKYGEACKNGRGEHGIMCYNSHSASHSWVHEPEWFCADGERRDDNG